MVGRLVVWLCIESDGLISVASSSQLLEYLLLSLYDDCLFGYASVGGHCVPCSFSCRICVLVDCCFFGHVSVGGHACLIPLAVCILGDRCFFGYVSGGGHCVSYSFSCMYLGGPLFL